MIPGRTIEDIEKYCGCYYENINKRIVGIMIARYSNPSAQDMIKQQYDYWHIKTGKDLLVYWLGYGAYYFPNKSGQFFVGDIGDEPSVFFDTEVFVQEVEKLNNHLTIHDEIGLLLCNYYDKKIHLDESVFFELEELMREDNNKRLRLFAEYLFELSKGKNDVAEVTKKLIREYNYLKIKPTNWFNTIIQGGLSVLGAI